jgi:L-fuconolactonase
MAFALGTLVTHKQLLVGCDEPILDPEIRIVDSHHYHLFDRSPLRYMLDEYLADTNAGHKIVASIYVETSAFARLGGPDVLRPLGEVEFVLGIGVIGASRVYGDCQVCAGIVGHADLGLGHAVAELLDRALEIAPERFRGGRQVAIDDPTEAPYRFVTRPPPRGLLQSPGFRPALRQIFKHSLTFDASVFHQQLQNLMHLVDAFPDGTIVLNHCGHAMAMEMDERGRKDVFRALMFEVARRPNVVCKVGGLRMPFWGFRFEERQDPIEYQDLATASRPYVKTAIEAFGTNRCMMESNFRPDGRSAGFVPTWNARKHIVRAASPDEKAQLFHDTAARIYRLNLPANL